MSGPTIRLSFIFEFDFDGNKFRINANTLSSQLLIFKKIFTNYNTKWIVNASTDPAIDGLITFLSLGYRDFQEYHVCTQKWLSFARQVIVSLQRRFSTQVIVSL